MDPWVRDAVAAIGRSAERELEALVGVSSPWGDRRGAEEAISLSRSLLPADAEVERLPSSSPSSAPDLPARLPGRGRKRILLLGYLDTVVPHSSHRPLERRGERLVGTGTGDMKGGVVLALGVLRAALTRFRRQSRLRTSTSPPASASGPLRPRASPSRTLPPAWPPRGQPASTSSAYRRWTALNSRPT